MIRPRHLAPVVTSALLAGVILSLVGCAPEPTAPVPSASVTQTPLPTPVPVTLASIQLGGSSLTLIGSDKSTLQKLEYSADPVVAVAALSKEIGETPTAETLASTGCSDNQKRFSWGDGLSLAYSTDTPARSPTVFVVRSDAAKTPSGVAVTTPNGFGVGDPISEMIAATPGVTVIGADTADQLGLEAFFDLNANDVGGVAISGAKTGLITFLTAPVGVSQDC
jgi:hypothetical protein